MGWCPSGRLFEAAACGAPILTDAWEGLDAFFEPGREILVARTDAPTPSRRSISAIASCARSARPGRERALSEHTSDRRAETLEAELEAARSRGRRRASFADGGLTMWGIVPAAGRGSRIQPLAFSKELLPVGSRLDEGVERPCAVSEYLVERMIRGGADKICFVISPGKSDIMEYYGAGYGEATHRLCGAAAAERAVRRDLPRGAADLGRRAGDRRPARHDLVPGDALCELPDDELSFLLFPVERPEFFDAVVLDGEDRVREIQVKQPDAASHWIWGAFKMPGRVPARARAPLARARCAGTSISAPSSTPISPRGGEAVGVKAGDAYVDVGTLHGYRAAIALLSEAARGEGAAGAHVALGWPAGRALDGLHAASRE